MLLCTEVFRSWFDDDLRLVGILGHLLNHLNRRMTDGRHWETFLVSVSAGSEKTTRTCHMRCPLGLQTFRRQCLSSLVIARVWASPSSIWLSKVKQSTLNSSPSRRRMSTLRGVLGGLKNERPCHCWVDVAALRATCDPDPGNSNDWHCVRGGSRHGRARVVVLIGSWVAAGKFLGWSPVTHVVVGRGVRTRAPPRCKIEQLSVLLVSALLSHAPVYRGCPVRTHQCDLVSRVRPDQSVNSCLRDCVRHCWCCLVVRVVSLMCRPDFRDHPHPLRPGRHCVQIDPRNRAPQVASLLLAQRVWQRFLGRVETVVALGNRIDQARCRCSTYFLPSDQRCLLKVSPWTSWSASHLVGSSH